MFIEWYRGGIPRVLDDPKIGMEACARRGSWGGLATVLGRPAYVISASLDPSSIDSLLGVAPWLGGKWGPLCHVSIRYTYQSSAIQPVPTPEEQELVTRAHRPGIPDPVSSGSGANPAWLDNLNRSDVYYFPLRLNGDVYVAAVAQKAYPSSGSLFFLFQAPSVDSQRLDSVAVFTMHWGAAGVKSIEAHNYSSR